MYRVLLFTNTIAPYRLPVFERLAQDVHLKVLFAQGKTTDRRWNPRLDAYTFRHAILSHHTLQMGGAAQVINSDLPAHILRHDVDVVILGENRQTALSGSLAALITWARRRPLIIWTGITPGEDKVAHSHPSLRRLFSGYRSLLFHHASAIVAYGTTTANYLSEQGINQDEVFSGTQVVPASQLPSPAVSKAELGLLGKNLVLSVNYLIPRKGIDTLIKAFQQVAGSNDALALLGSGPEEAYLRSLADGDARILFPGYQSGSRKTAWYAAADLFAFPTLHDPWGLVVNEAMAFGLPIIATHAAGCVPDLVQGNGLVVPAGDIEALASALAQLLENEGLRRKMGQRSQAIIADYTVERASHTFLNAIQYTLES